MEETKSANPNPKLMGLKRKKSRKIEHTEPTDNM